MLVSVLLIVVCCSIAASSPPPPSPPPLQQQQHWMKELLLKDVNGGTGCAVCTVLVGLVQQLAEIHNSSVVEAIDKLCSFLPAGQFQNACTQIATSVPDLLEFLDERDTPDVICHSLKVCKNDTGEFCRLFPPPKLNHGEDIHLRVTKGKDRIGRFLPKSFSICDLEPIKAICNSLNDHTPVSDSDHDLFSHDIRTLRGSYWRGKDCDDSDGDIYPGRNSLGGDASVDTNCNGIVGVEPGSGKTYEALWCNGTQQMGTIVLGDSASAHFHIPPAWLTSREMSEEAFKDLLMVLENEFDWPMLSTVTGFMNSTWPNSIQGKVDSTYLRLLELNRCNHRDFQNIGVNGARASDMAKQIVKTLARRGAKDKPVFLTLALIGNDVCNGHPGMSHMTKPDDFYRSTLETLTFVDQHVAPGSVVIANGLVDGRVLYETLSDRIHPVGSLHKDVTYSQVYDFLNCLQISPCFGWMNSNETWRNLTTQRAMELNVALKQVIANNSFDNFNVSYLDPPLPAIIQDWKKMGRDPAQLIEPVDGFHPSQAGHALNTELTFKILQDMGVLPKSNPFNEKIRQKFGDQGGYL